MRSNIGAGIAAAVLILGITTACVPTKSPAPSPLAGRSIVIDPGHNGQNWAHPDEINTPVWIGTQFRACDTTGTATDGGYTESAYNLDVALRLADLLRQNGQTSC